MSKNNATPATVTVSDWQCHVSEGAPNGFSVSAPRVETTTDASGDFEISTVTVSFAGAAQYGTHAFTLNYSFKLSSGENLVDLRVSSDDNATLTACGKTANSSLGRDGWARSDWSETRMGVAEVSGSYTNVGGPHNMTATILVVRSLTGKIYDVNFNVSAPSLEKKPPYEIREVVVTCSGNAPSGSFGFTATKTLSIPGGNWTEIEVVSDDNATVTAGEFSVSSRIGAAGSGISDWAQTAPEMIPVTVTLTNIGGPFSLTAKIRTKKSQRMLKFACASETYQEQLQGFADLWRRAGIGEPLYIEVCDRDGVTLSEQTVISVGDKSGVDSVNFNALDKKGRMAVIATCTDGEVIEKEIEVVEPESLDIVEVSCVLNSEEKYSETPDGERTLEGIFRANSLKYKIKVCPLDVSFGQVCVKELVGTRDCDGIADSDSFEHLTTHHPSDLLFLSDQNTIEDTVGATEGHGWVLPFVKKIGLMEVLETDSEDLFGQFLFNGNFIW